MDSFAEIDVRVRVKGGGHVSQVYAIRQAIAKALVAYYAKNVDAASAFELKKKYIDYDRTLLIADPRRMEPKKFGGRGARARRQKRYVCSHLQRKRGPLISPQQLPLIIPVLFPVYGSHTVYAFMLLQCLNMHTSSTDYKSILL